MSLVRFNAMYENSDTFRDYGHFERYGINPTVTLKPTDDTKIKLSYEFYHDFRLADRGNPSQGLPGGATRFNPTGPFAPNGDLSTFFGSPFYNYPKVEVRTGLGWRRRGDAGSDAAFAERLSEQHAARKRLQPDRLCLQDRDRAGVAHR